MTLRIGRMIASLAITITLASAPADDAIVPEFVSMFDGKTLAGWEVIPEKSIAAWSAIDGKIVGDGDKGRCYLSYTKNKQIADFELKFSYRFPGKGNSGVNIRSRVQQNRQTRIPKLSC